MAFNRRTFVRRDVDEWLSIAASWANHGAEAGNAQEAEGVLNPAAVRGLDGQLNLFPRLVARGNKSRIGIARVKFNEVGDPTGVQRLGIALEPETDYELRPDGSGGCEDPRITFVERLQRYVMTYTAHSPIGPRIALAVSEDLFHWKRLGLATFEDYRGIDHRDDLGLPDSIDVYYEMADSRIGVARLNLPDHLPPGAPADPPAAAVKERDCCAQEGS